MRLIEDKSGQSLVEILVGLAVGALLIGAASIAVAFILRSGSTIQTLTTSTNLTEDLLNRLETFSLSNWSSIYNLPHGSTSTYFLAASGTGFAAVGGEEGMIDNEIKNGLVGRWGFDEGTGTVTYDESGNGNTGTLTNSPAWQATSTCKMSYCLSFSGGNWVVVQDPSSGVLDPTSQYTLSAWIRYATTTGYGFIISKSSGGSGGGYELFRNTGSGAIRFSSCDVSGNCGGGYFDITTPLGYNDGGWHQVVATVATGSTANIYVDGTLVKQSGTVTQNNVQNSYNLFIGARGQSGGNGFNGFIDDVRIYNRALSASEIKLFYNSSVFRRYFYVQDICRNVSNGGSTTIQGNPPCGGGYFDDPSTQEVTAVTEWDAAGKISNTILSAYLTRWSNFVFNQTDWSGGSGQTGVFSAPANQYASGTNITTTPLGSVQIQNLSQ